MCQCTPDRRTPFCGQGSCKWPHYKTVWIVALIDAVNTPIFAVDGGFATTAIEATRFDTADDAIRWMIAYFRDDVFRWEPMAIVVDVIT